MAWRPQKDWTGKDTALLGCSFEKHTWFLCILLFPAIRHYIYRRVHFQTMCKPLNVPQMDCSQCAESIEMIQRNGMGLNTYVNVIFLFNLLFFYCFYCCGSDSGGNIRNANSVSFNMHVFCVKVY